MLNNPVLQHLPPLVALRVLLVLLDVVLDALRPLLSENLRLPQCLAIQSLDVRPPLQLLLDEALDEVATEAIGPF